MKNHNTFMLTLPATNQVMTKADLREVVQPWQDALELRVRAQELKQDTAITYKRGVVKFLTLLAGKRPSADIVRAWKAELLSNKIRPASVNTWIV